MVVGPDGLLPLPWLAAPLARALATSRAHALLVHGPSGGGQFEFAVALAQAWLCEAEPGPERRQDAESERGPSSGIAAAAGNPARDDHDAGPTRNGRSGDGSLHGAAPAPVARPCGRCTACRLMQARAHPDFLLLLPDALREPLGWAGESDAEERGGDGAKKAKPSREILIKPVRAAIDWSQQSSSRGHAKVVVIHPAQAMNLVTANALLKTLEEPPGLLRLVLCAADPEGLLPTLRSRCQRVRLEAPPEAEALAWLRGAALAEPEVLLRAAGGQPSEALALAAAGFDAPLWRRLAHLARAGDAQALVGLPVPRLIEALQKLCHDLMAQAAGGAPRYFAPADLPPGATLAGLVAWAQALADAARHAEHPWNAGLLIEALVSRAQAAWPGARAGSPLRGRPTGA